jgi:YihY family inner membrane protein
MTPRQTPSLLDRVTGHLPGPLRAAVEQSQGHDVLLFAAALGFYALVSVAPLVIFVLWLMGIVAGDTKVQRLAEEIRRIAPPNLGADKALRRVAELGTQLSLPAAIGALWPATSYGAGLKRAFERLSSGKDKQAKGLRGRALAVFLLLPLLVLGALVSSYLGAAIVGESGLARIAGIVLGLLAGYVGAGVATALIYRIFPRESLSWRAIARGTAVTAAGVSVLSLAFSVYLVLGADFKEHYASSGLAGIVLLAVWLFLANALLLVGYLVARESMR